MSGSALVELLLWQLRAAQVREPIREHRFHSTRRWRLDLAWPDRMVGAEVDGGTYIGGRHVTGSGFERDAEKLSEAAAAGWRVLRLTRHLIESGRGLALIEQALA